MIQIKGRRLGKNRENTPPRLIHRGMPENDITGASPAKVAKRRAKGDKTGDRGPVKKGRSRCKPTEMVGPKNKKGNTVLKS